MTNTTRKKVLILTYYWPPAGGPGVQRVLKLVKYLPDFGWDPIILTVKDGEYPAFDPSLEKEIPPSCRVIQTRTVEFFKAFRTLSGKGEKKPADIYLLKHRGMKPRERLFTWIRQAFFVPDARLGWIPFAISKGVQVIREEQPDLIFSCSPPHSLQIAAYFLAHQHRLPWVADFRDPWTDAFWEKSVPRPTLSHRLNIAIEQRIIRGAHAITTVSAGFKELLLKRQHTKAYVLPNAYDNTDFEVKKQRSPTFRITYAGNISASQNPVQLFGALAKLRARYGSLLEIHFYGTFHRQVLDSIEEAQLRDIIHLHDYLPHKQVVSKITDSDLLILLIPKHDGKGILTGKVYEYLATQNFILGISNEHGEVGQLLEECRCGTLCSYDEDPFDILYEQVGLWQQGIPLRPNIAAIRQYERKNIARKLAHIFEQQLQPD